MVRIIKIEPYRRRIRRGCAAPLTRLDPDTPVGANGPRLRLATLLKVADNGCNASILFFRTPCMLSRIILDANNYFEGISSAGMKHTRIRGSIVDGSRQKLLVFDGIV